MGRPLVESLTVPLSDAVACAAATAGMASAAAMNTPTVLQLSKCRLIDLPPNWCGFRRA
jgi:hypothetical protein